jgi:hypothetical protein
MVALDMSTLYWRDPDRKRNFRPPAKVFYLGLTLFVVSFFLPSLNQHGHDHVVGWGCAVIAFFGFSSEANGVSGLAVFGGLINPLALVYIVLRIRDRARNVRFFLALAMVTFIPISWMSLAIMHLGILIGHVFWIVGLLLLIDWNDFRSRREKKTS